MSSQSQSIVWHGQPYSLGSTWNGVKRIVSRHSTGCSVNADYEVHGDRGLTAHWKFSHHSEFILMANLGADSLSGLIPPVSQMIYPGEQVNADARKRKTLPAWLVVSFLES